MPHIHKVYMDPLVGLFSVPRITPKFISPWTNRKMFTVTQYKSWVYLNILLSNLPNGLNMSTLGKLQDINLSLQPGRKRLKSNCISLQAVDHNKWLPRACRIQPHQWCFVPVCTRRSCTMLGTIAEGLRQPRASKKWASGDKVKNKDGSRHVGENVKVTFSNSFKCDARSVDHYDGINCDQYAVDAAFPKRGELSSAGTWVNYNDDQIQRGTGAKKHGPLTYG